MASPASHSNSSESETRPTKSPRRWSWTIIILTLIVLCTMALRVRLLAVPLDRDEGEYAYAGQLILQGVAPYQQIYNMKTPGVYASYALIMGVLGQSPQSIHAGLLLINAIDVVLVFLLTRKFFNNIAALAAAGSFAMLSLGQAIIGFSANSEHFVLLPALAGLLILLRSFIRRRDGLLLPAGLCLGLAFVMKQHGAAFVLAGVLWFAWDYATRQEHNFYLLAKRGALLGTGVIIPFFITCAILWWCGVFDRFWFWTFTYARHYIQQVPLQDGCMLLLRQVQFLFSEAPLIWTLSLVGLLSLAWNSRARGRHIELIALVICSAMAVTPGLLFRDHYFFLLLPAVALLFGAAVLFVLQILRKIQPQNRDALIAAVIMLLSLGWMLYSQRSYFFHDSPSQISVNNFGINPFVQSVEIARQLRERSDSTDTIAVLGSEPQIYFLSQRKSATGYIYMYPLMESQPFARRMQRELISQIEKARPRFVVFVSMLPSWLMRDESQREIFEWWPVYAQKHYHPVGLLRLEESGWASTWGPMVREPEDDAIHILVSERND